MANLGNREMETASQHISNIMSRAEDFRGDAEEELRKAREKITALQDIVQKSDEAMGILKELDDMTQEAYNDYELDLS